MAKKLVSIILVLSLCFVFVGCESGGTSSEEEVSYTYTMLANKPDDWDTNWSAYFEMGSDGNPVALSGEAAPDFVAGKYLARGVVQKQQDETLVDDIGDDVESDGGTTDTGTTDNGTADTGTTDNGTADTGTADNGTNNNTATNNGTTNNGTTNNGTANTGTTNNGTANNGTANSGTTNNGTANSGTANNTATNNGTANSGTSNNGTTNNGTTNNGTANTNSKVEAQASKSTKFASDPYSDVPAEVKGTTVEYLMCRPITDNDKTLIANFEKKTGIKVQLTYAEYGGYGTTVANRVAAKNSPDIIIGERVAYPNGLISLCEPLDAETFKLDDPFWDLESMKGCKFRGKYYGVFTNHTIYHDARMMMINVPLLKQILGSDYATKSPRALWKAGKWDLEAFYDLCVKIKNDGYMPLTYISQYDFALASGQDLVSFDGTKFSSNLSNKTLQKAWGWFNEFVNTNGLMETYNQNNFLAQKDVFFINTIYNCYNKESIAGWAKFEVDAVPVPGVNGVTSAPCDFRPYSIAKGAKNPVGAAYFLRFLLDDQNNFSKVEAVNDNVWETAQFVSNKLPKTFEFSSSLLLYVSESAEGSVRTHLVKAEKGQMASAFAKCENLVANAVKRVNKAVLKVK